MREVKRLILVSLLYVSLLPIWAQQSPITYVDSITDLTISNDEKALQVEHYFSSLPNNTSHLEDAYYVYAKWCFVDYRNFKKAILYGKKERALRLKKFDSTADNTKKNLYNLGYFNYYSVPSNLRESKAYFDTLVSVSEDHEVRLGRAYRELGNIYNEWGDFQNALEHYTTSEQIFKRGKREDEIIITLTSILGMYMKLEDVSYFEDFKKIQKKLDTFNIEIPKYRKAPILHNTAAMYEIVDSLDVAEKNAQQAFSYYKELEYDDDAFRAVSLLGVIEIKRNNFKKARDYYTIARTYANEDKILLSNISNNLGDLELKSENYETAIDHYYNAISWVNKGETSIKRQLPNQKDISVSPNKKRLFGYLYDLAKAWLTYYDKTQKKAYLLKAYEVIELTDTTVDELFLESQEELSKLSWRKKASHLYMDAIKVAYLLNRPEIVFHFMEKKKGLLLLENTAETLAKQRANIPKQTLEVEENMLSTINAYLYKIENSSTEELPTEEVEAIQKQLFTLKRKYRKFIDSIETIYPVYVRSKKQLTISSLDEIQEALQGNEQIISYAIGDHLGYVMHISKHEIQCKQISISTPSLNQQIEEFQEVLTHPFNTKEDVIYYKKSATNLTQVVLPFIRFRESVPESTLIIIPDGFIQKVPFEALILDENQKLPDAYLINSYNISYKYSLSLDAHITQLQPTENENISFLPTNFKDNYLEKLPNSIKEVNEIRPYYEDHMYTEENATKNSFLGHYENHSIIHISTHGGTDTHGAWLAFYDEKLRLEELYATKKRKELVVLSACKTDVGDLKKGEGVFSIKRGFFKSGARSVISTLWDVNEKASMEITSSFYKEIASGKKKSEALRNAKLTYLKKHANTSEASPYYWSGITLTGHDNTIDFGLSSNISFWVFLGIGSILILVFLYKKTISK